jgi:hypothetical protein
VALVAGLATVGSTVAAGAAKPAPVKRPVVVSTCPTVSFAECRNNGYESILLGSDLYVLRASDGALLQVGAAAKKATVVETLGPEAVGRTLPSQPGVDATTVLAGMTTLDGELWGNLSTGVVGETRIQRLVGKGKAPDPVATTQTNVLLTAADGKLWTLTTRPESETAGVLNARILRGLLASLEPGGTALETTDMPAAGYIAGTGKYVVCDCRGVTIAGPQSSSFDYALIVDDVATGTRVLEDPGTAMTAAGFPANSKSGGFLPMVAIDDTVWGVWRNVLGGTAFVRLDLPSLKFTMTAFPSSSPAVVPSQLATDGTELWGLTKSGGEITRYDPNTLAVIGCLPEAMSLITWPGVTSPQAIDLDVGNGTLWITSQEGRVARISTSTPTTPCA